MRGVFVRLKGFSWAVHGGARVGAYSYVRPMVADRKGTQVNAQSIGTIGTLSMFGLTSAGLLVGAGVANHQETRAVSIAALGETLSGVLDEADLDGKSFTLRTEDDRQYSFTFDDKTTFTLNGEPSSVEAVLEVGAAVSATVDENGLASNVSRSTE